jgi:tape measure domain-containing protein
MSEFLEILSPSALEQLREAEKLVNKLANDIKTINNFKASSTPSGSDEKIKQLNIAYKEQSNALKLLKQELDNATNAQIKSNNQKISDIRLSEAQRKATLAQQQAEAKVTAETQRALAASERLNSAYNKLNKARTDAKNHLRDLIASERASTAEINKAQKAFDVLDQKVRKADKAVGDMSKNVGNYKSAFSGLSNLMGAFGIGTGIYLAVDVAKNIYETTKALQSLDLALKMVSGSEQEFASNRAFITATAEKWGVEIKTLTEQYTYFYTAAKGLMSTAEIKTTFEGIAKAGAVMGLSLEKQSAAFYAFEQMMSKGIVTSEELKKQLGNSMPGAIRAAAMAYMDLHPQIKSIQEAEKMLLKEMKNGAIDSATYVPLIVKNLEKLYGIEMVDKVETLQASQNRLKNSWTELVRTMNESKTGGISSFFKTVTDNLKDVLDFITLLNKDETAISVRLENTARGETDALKTLNEIKKQGLQTDKELIETAKLKRQYAQKQADDLTWDINSLEQEGKVLQKTIKEIRKKDPAFYGNRGDYKDAKYELNEINKKIRELAGSYGFFRGIVQGTNVFMQEQNKKTGNGISTETEEQKAARLKAEKEALDNLEKHLKDLYDLKMAQLEKDKFLLAFDISVKEMEIATAKYQEEQRLSKGNDEKLKIADIKFWTEKEKLAKDAVKRINDIKYKPQYARQDLADAEKFGEGVGVLSKDQMEGAISDWEKLQAKKKKDQEDELDRLKAMRQVINDIFSDFGQATGFENTMDVFAKIGKNGKTFWENLTGGEEGVVEMRDALFAGLAVMEDVVGKFEDAEEQKHQKRLARLEKEKEVALRFAGDSTTAKAKIESDFDKKKKELELKAFKRQKAIALANIAINTAQAVMSVLSTGGGAHYLDFGASAGILSAFVTAAGLTQAVMVMSQKPPEYWKGTDNAEAGLAWTQERGAEIVTDKHGHIKDFGSDKGAKLTMMEKGDKVYNAEQTKRLMFNNELNSIMMDNGIGNAPPIIVNSGMTKSEMREVMIETLGGQPKVIHNVDKNGFSTYISHNGNITRRAEQRGSGNGITV